MSSTVGVGPATERPLSFATSGLGQAGNSAGLGRGIREGIFWNIAGPLLARALSLLFLIVLARLLTPRDYGLFGLANIVMGFAAILSNVGAGAALIQRQGDLGPNANAAFYMNALAAALLSGLVFLASPWVATFYKEPAVKGLLQILSLTFFLRASAAIHEAFLRKELLYRKLQLITLGSSTVYGLLAVVLAWRGWGARSIAFGFLGSNLAMAALLWLFSGLPLSLNLHRDRWKDLFGYGRHIFLAGLIWYFVLQGDGFVVGKSLGATALGAYALASNYGRMPQMLIGSAISDVMFSAFSRVQDQPEKLRELLFKSMRLTALVGFPLAAILFLTADVLILTLFGDKWITAIVPFRLFVSVFTILMVGGPFPSLYQALNKPFLNLLLGVATLPVFGLGLAVGVRFGTIGVGLAVTGVMTLSVISQMPLVSHLLKVRLATLLRQLAPSAVSVLVALAIALLISTSFSPVGIRNRLMLIVPGFLVGYAVSLKVLYPSVWTEAWNLMSAGHGLGWATGRR